MNAWHTEKPELNRVVEVWNRDHIELATWDGETWRALSGALSGAPLVEITHWRERTPLQVHA